VFFHPPEQLSQVPDDVVEAQGNRQGEGGLFYLGMEK